MTTLGLREYHCDSEFQMPSLLVLPTVLSAPQEGLVDIVTRLYLTDRPRGRDVGTQTDGDGMEDKATEMKWVFV